MWLDKIRIINSTKQIDGVLDKKALTDTHKDLKIKKPVDYHFVGDNELLILNRKTLSHNYYTDIITFDYEDDEDLTENEIVISWERVGDNAKKYNESFKRELHRVCIHGLLHLAGYNDLTPGEKEKMRKEEDRFLTLYCST